MQMTIRKFPKIRQIPSEECSALWLRVSYPCHIRAWICHTGYQLNSSSTSQRASKSHLPIGKEPVSLGLPFSYVVITIDADDDDDIDAAAADDADDQDDIDIDYADAGADDDDNDDNDDDDAAAADDDDEDEDDDDDDDDYERRCPSLEANIATPMQLQRRNA